MIKLTPIFPPYSELPAPKAQFLTDFFHFLTSTFSKESASIHVGMCSVQIVESLFINIGPTPSNGTRQRIFHFLERIPFFFPILQYFHLEYDNLARFPPSFKNLAQLRYFKFVHNGPFTFPDDFFENMQVLQQFVTSNAIFTALPLSLASIPSLQVIKVDLILQLHRELKGQNRLPSNYAEFRDRCHHYVPITGNRWVVNDLQSFLQREPDHIKWPHALASKPYLIACALQAPATLSDHDIRFLSKCCSPDERIALEASLPPDHSLRLAFMTYRSVRTENGDLILQ